MPYLGFFHRLLHADEWVVLDHVQLSKRGWVHRDKIKVPTGEQWITVPVQKIGEGQTIREAEIGPGDHLAKLVRVIKSNYQAAPYFADVFVDLEEILLRGHSKLFDLNMALLHQLLRWFDIVVPMRLSSSLQVTTRKSQLNADIVKAVGGDTYLSGTGAKAYHEDGPFLGAGLRVRWHDFRHPTYPQLHGEFVPCLSSVDLLFNCGVERSREILRNC